MAENTKIEWATHTWNPWIGCTKVSPGCDRCYAEALSKRYGWAEWGPHGERKRTSEENWRKPFRWARAAKAHGTRPRVFCASLADVFDNQVSRQWRYELLCLIDQTQELDWLLLTKRPENIEQMIWEHPIWDDGLPPNLWLGTTAEDQDRFDHRWSILAEIPAIVRFISYEPAIGPLSLPLFGPRPDWVICGGETGRGARMMDLEWARQLRDECELADVRFFFKQTTHKGPIPADLMVRQFPKPTL